MKETELPQQATTKVHHSNNARHRKVLHLPPEIAFDRIKIMKIELKLAELKEIRKEHKSVLREKYMMCSDACGDVCGCGCSCASLAQRET